jgi:hypothetical protein
VNFESFENTYIPGGNKYFEDGLRYDVAQGTVDANASHAGRKSFDLKVSAAAGKYQGTLRLKDLTLDENLTSKGWTIKFWVKSDYADLDFSEVLRLQLTKLDPTGPILYYDIPFNKVSRTGEWTLMEASIFSFSSPVATRFSVDIVYRNSYGDKIWLDDIISHPREAKKSGYVYDVLTLRLMASFDDQHFGLYYQYNGEGKLIRKFKETEKGIKPVEETQYNLPATHERPTGR